MDRSVAQSNVNVKFSLVAGFLKAVPGSVQYNTAVDSDTKVYNKVFKTDRSVKNEVHFRSRSPLKQLAVKSRKFKSRDREPSRISLRKVIHSLKFRKLRLKVKHVVKLGSSVIIFFRFKKCITWSFAFNVSKRNILLSGDVELYPGPVTDGRISS